MLLQFAVTNFRCFAQEALLSMVASSSKDHAERIYPHPKGKIRILPVAALYGGNGHGKTQLVEALFFAKKFIRKGVEPEKPTGVSSFRLDPVIKKSPTTFEFRILHQGWEYLYGFSLTQNRVMKEWLEGRDMGKSRSLNQIFFQRNQEDGEDVAFYFGPPMQNSKEFARAKALIPRANQLFLTLAGGQELTALKPVFDWFGKYLHVIGPEAKYGALLEDAVKIEGFLENLGKILAQAGTGIAQLKLEEQEWTPDHLPTGYKKSIQDDLAKGEAVSLDHGNQLILLLPHEDNEKIKKLSLKTIHASTSGEEIPFELHEESSGTRRLLDLLPILSLPAGATIVLDELDRTLHPLLSRLFLQRFLETCHPGHPRQLIFTTHESHLLDLDLLRRDEIWFVEKDPTGGSHIHALSDLRVRNDLRIENGYLNGRFGGIPFIGNAGDLGEPQSLSRSYRRRHASSSVSG